MSDTNDNTCQWSLSDDGWTTECGETSDHEHNEEDPCCEYCANFVVLD